ncbi:MULTISPECIES: glutamate--tRNA ligase [Sphingobium]|jgi:glutamyl-tRNA synthetase|uniref:glutamate--tRNA ligase n=1 Tax=Sphingobium TaxID=165695 RepID=UPI000C597DFE|nr:MULTISPECIES: glutamate--tRNA ligase [Sphingobium]MAP43763.1 glutamate--tRNA ligase [Sphingobium sp.]MBS50488.1 glutamate--tRNA ligase [Sphingobium sp.]MCC4256376.1 glutamate--tRNA ligase [Sphingobium lactosutens]HCW61726.1 glutamate--tRNA ligase [Sphingobium sp.]|tara:strand:+ start:160 stop:1488 length:1329 start_codon:yes stop_codon:yes gene_type:complete
MTVITRFAPSPTGNLHVGNIRAALHNWLWARKSGGTFLLRLDDTDLERSRAEYADAIRADLQWLGLHWDGVEKQSDRFALYEARFEALKASGHVYPAYETSQELDLRRKILLGRGLPPVYDRAALALTPEQIAASEAEGRAPHWRFKLDHDQPIVWTDLIRGEQRFDPKLLSDPVIRRADGSWLYMLPSVIDDIDMGVTHVLRGEDHVSNTATQIQMFAALGAPLPHFAHEALLTGSEGKLSKRLGSLGVAHFREMGLEPIAIAALLARLGSSQPIEPFADMQPLIDSFDFAHFGRAPARFDEGELAALNQKIVHQFSYAAVADRLPDGMDAAAWDAIRPNLETVAGAADWWRIVTGPIDAPEVEEGDRDFLATAHRILTDAPFDADIWRTLTGALKDETGRKGKTLFLPLRRALTGLDHGPDMAQLLPLIGRDQALTRLAG